MRKEDFNWLGFDWGRRGGLQARELALWVQLQREFRRRNLLGTDAIKRLEAIGFNWEPEVGGSVSLFLLTCFSSLHTFWSHSLFCVLWTLPP